MSRVLTLGSKGLDVSYLQSKLTGKYSEYIDKQGEFTYGTLKALTLYQRDEKYEEASAFSPSVGMELFVAGGPLFEPSGDSSESSRISSTIEDGFYLYQGKSQTAGRSLIANPDGSGAGEVPSARVYKKKAFCGNQTWARFRQNAKADASYRYKLYDNLKSIPKPSQIVGTLRGLPSNVLNPIGDFANIARGYIQDAFASLGFAESFIRGIKGDAVAAGSSEDLMIVNLTSEQTVIMLPTVPDSVSVSRSAYWMSEVPQGRTAGYHGFQRLSDSSVSFSVTLNCRDFVSVESYEKMRRNITALSYPDYNNGVVLPPSCYVSLPSGIKFVGYCTRSSPSYSGDIIDGYYSTVSFNLDFTAVSDVPFSSKSVMEGEEWWSQPYHEAIATKSEADLQASISDAMNAVNGL